MNLLDRLLDHDHWATTQLLDLSRGLTDEQIDQPFDIGHRTVRATFGHMIPNVEFWTSSMVKKPVPYEPAHASVDDMLARHERSYATFAGLARTLRDEQRFDDTFGDHFDEQMTFGGGVLHVILHNEDHRTEVLHIHQRLGVPDLPEVDHGLWDFGRRGF